MHAVTEKYIDPDLDEHMEDDAHGWDQESANVDDSLMTRGDPSITAHVLSSPPDAANQGEEMADDIGKIPSTTRWWWMEWLICVFLRGSGRKRGWGGHLKSDCQDFDCKRGRRSTAINYTTGGSRDGGGRVVGVQALEGVAHLVRYP